MSLKTIKIIFTAIGAAYFFAPVDIIPDFLGLPGRIDDLAVIIYLVWRYRKMRQPEWTQQSSSNESTSQRKSSENSNSSTRVDSGRFKSSPDPYSVLGLSKGVNRDKITQSYRELIKKYHPDRVNHLGDEFKKIAHEKTIEIQKAYDEIVGSISNKPGR